MSRIVVGSLPPGYGTQEDQPQLRVAADPVVVVTTPIAAVPVIDSMVPAPQASGTMAAVPILGANPLVVAVASSTVKLEDPRVKSAVRTDVGNRRFLFLFGSKAMCDVTTLLALEIKSTEDVSRGAQILRRLYAELPFKSYPRRGGTVSKQPKDMWLDAVKAMDEVFAAKLDRFLNGGGLNEFLAKRQFN